jgi:hypothetical protein
MTDKPEGKKSIVGIMVGVGVAIGVAIGSRFLFAGGPPTAADMDKELVKSRAGKVIKERFVEDYNAVLARLVVLANDKTLNDDQRRMAAAESSAAVRVKHAPFILKAPTDALNNVLRTQADVLTAFEAQRGAAACARFANLGAAELGSNLTGLEEKIDVAGEATMNAIADGRDKPVARVEATEEDFNTFFTALAAKGFTDDSLNMMSNSTPEDSDCKDIVTMLSTAMEIPGDVGDRIRVNVVGGIVSTT